MSSSGPKTDNTRLAVKLEIRRLIISGLSPASRRALRVLECCAGQGIIWKHLAREYPLKNYLPLDLAPQLAGTFKTDSRIALAVLDLGKFNVIDVDTYGEPWAHWLTLTKRIGPGRTAVFLTHGHISLGSGGAISKLARRCLGIPQAWEIPMATKLQKYSAKYCLTAGCESVTILSAKRWRSDRVDYYGFLLEPKRARATRRKAKR